jgi:hypothetical protein
LHDEPLSFSHHLLPRILGPQQRHTSVARDRACAGARLSMFPETGVPISRGRIVCLTPL